MIKTDTLTITPDILGLIAELDEFKGAWRALGTLAPERLLALRRVATIESIGSSTRIEGSRLFPSNHTDIFNDILVREGLNMILKAIPLTALMNSCPGAGIP
ncbi:hypothetical protein [Asticcacaulis benevestitus]|nr:hypothetical protein [Asticcacaulis benevestitus]